VLGLYAGWGTPNTEADERLAAMLADFVGWFEREFKQHYGGIECAEIVGDDMRNKMARCPGIVTESLARLKQILADYNYDFDRPNPA
jgi:hypothetical protein